MQLEEERWCSDALASYLAGGWGVMSAEDKASQHNKRKSSAINQEVDYDPTHTS